jgi:hypothetical protein
VVAMPIYLGVDYGDIFSPCADCTRVCCACRRSFDQ